MSTTRKQAVEQEYGPLLDAIDERVEASLAPVRAQNAELRGRMEELSKPIHDSRKMFGGPAARRRLDELARVQFRTDGRAAERHHPSG